MYHSAQEAKAGRSLQGQDQPGRTPQQDPSSENNQPKQDRRMQCRGPRGQVADDSFALGLSKLAVSRLIGRVWPDHPLLLEVWTIIPCRTG